MAFCENLLALEILGICHPGTLIIPLNLFDRNDRILYFIILFFFFFNDRKCLLMIKVLLNERTLEWVRLPLTFLCCRTGISDCMLSSSMKLCV